IAVLSQTSAKSTARRGSCATLCLPSRGDHTSDSPRWREIVRRVDVAHHARIADRNFHEVILVRAEQAFGALVAAQPQQLHVKASRHADRVAAPGTEIG